MHVATHRSSVTTLSSSASVLEHPALQWRGGGLSDDLILIKISPLNYVKYIYTFVLTL